MAFNKTEVEVHTGYSVESVEPEWLKVGVKSPKHLMLDPEPCILCRACEDVCPYNCIFMMSPQIVGSAQSDAVEAEVQGATALFIVDDNACTRCAVCVDRCPSDCLYFARLPDDSARTREMAAVPMSQAE